MSKKKKYMGKKYQKLKRYILKEKPDTNPSELDELWIKLSQTKSHGGTRRVGCNTHGVPCGVAWSVGRYGANGVTAGVTFNLGGGMIN